MLNDKYLNESFKYMVCFTVYVTEEIFSHKHIEENGDITEISILRVPKTVQNPNGVTYSLVYVRNGERLIGYDNFEGHAEIAPHHKHLKDKLMPYDFVDEWKLIEDFMQDVEKIKRGIIK